MVVEWKKKNNNIESGSVSLGNGMAALKTKTNEIKINQHFNEKGIGGCAYAKQKERRVLTIGRRWANVYLTDQ